MVTPTMKANIGVEETTKRTSNTLRLRIRLEKLSSLNRKLMSSWDTILIYWLRMGHWRRQWQDNRLKSMDWDMRSKPLWWKVTGQALIEFSLLNNFKEKTTNIELKLKSCWLRSQNFTNNVSKSRQLKIWRSRDWKTTMSKPAIHNSRIWRDPNMVTTRCMNCKSENWGRHSNSETKRENRQPWSTKEKNKCCFRSFQPSRQTTNICNREKTMKLRKLRVLLRWRKIEQKESIVWLTRQQGQVMNWPWRKWRNNLAIEFWTSNDWTTELTAAAKRMNS